MKKSLIAIGIAAVLAAPLAAQAGVEVYGQVRASVDFVNNNSPSPSTVCAASGSTTAIECDDSAISVSSNASRMGFKGDEDLGGDLKVLWQIEQQMDWDTAGFATSGRNTFIGLQGGFGTFLLGGKYESPFRLATAKMDVFSDTKADYNAIIGNVGGTRVFDNRFNNILVYMTPEMQGFKAVAGYAPNRTDDDLPVSKTDGEKDVSSVGLMYGNGPLSLAGSYEVLGSNSGGDDGKAYRLGVGYTFGAGTTVNALFENADTGATERDAWYLSAAHKWDANTVKAAFAMADDLDGVSDSGATQISVGYAREMTKNTELYALYSVVSNDKSGTYGLWSGSVATPGYADESASVFSFGINHKFSSK